MAFAVTKSALHGVSSSTQGDVGQAKTCTNVVR